MEDRIAKSGSITEEEIEARRTPNGGFTMKTLKRWGVPWPPPKGWKKRLITGGVPFDKGDTH